MPSPFDRIMTTARIQLPGAIDDALRQELFEVALDFFKRSDCWREEIEVEVEPNKQEGYISPYAGRVERLISVTEDERAVYGATMPDEGILRLRHTDTRGRNVKALVALTVTDPLTRDAFPIVPQELVRRYHSAFLAGLLSKMMAQPAKPYTNVQLAAYHQNRFIGEASRARNAMYTGNTTGSQRWRFPANFA